MLGRLVELLRLTLLGLLPVHTPSLLPMTTVVPLLLPKALVPFLFSMLRLPLLPLFFATVKQLRWMSPLQEEPDLTPERVPLPMSLLET